MNPEISCVPISMPSAAVRDAAAAALRAGATHYTDRAGIPSLRTGLLTAINATPPVEVERVIITTGRQEALFLALCGHAARSGHVIAVEARDQPLAHSLGMAFTVIDPADVAHALDGHEQSETALLLLYRDSEEPDPSLVATALAAGATVLICEQPPADPRRPFTSLAELGWAEEVLIAGDLGTTGLSRWGAGYLLGPLDLITPLVELKQGLNICTAGLAQHATVAALREVAARRGDGGAAQSANALPSLLPRTTTADHRPGPGAGAAPSTVSDEGTRQRYELLDLLSVTHGAITLGRGDPDLATPQPIVEAAITSMSRPPSGERHPLGLRELRAAIATKLLSQNSVTVDPDAELLVTTGGQEAIFLLLQVLVARGDEILMPGPRYTTYDVGVNLAGASIVTVPPSGPIDFRLNVDALQALITPRTRALLIITPGNPTACVADRERLAAVAEIAQRHDLVVISDEIYERITYDAVEHVSIASLPGMAQRTVTVGGFSKAYAMTGWRVGYMAGPAAIINRVSALKQLWSGTTSEVSQHAAHAALTAPRDLSLPALTEYAARREIALAALDRMGLPFAPAQGAFYAFFDISTLGLHSYDLSRRLLAEAGIFLYPGSGFGAEWSSYMRMAWLQPRPRLQEALGRMESWITTHARPEPA